MISYSASVASTLFFIAAVAVFIAACRFAAPLRARFGSVLSRLEPVVLVACVGLGYLLMELPYNSDVLQIPAQYVVLDLAALGLIFCILYFLTLRSKASVALFLVVCLIFGTTNHFMAIFKGQPLLPSDVLAVQTAVAVSNTYDFVIVDILVICAALVLLAMAVVVCLPKVSMRHLGWLGYAKRLCWGVLALAVFAGAMGTVDIEKDLDVTVDIWASLESYQHNGSLISFLQRSQKLEPSEPDGYSKVRAQGLLREASSEIGEDDQAVAEELGTTQEETTKPTIIAVMSETYSDISTYQQLAASYAGPASLTDRAGVIASGNVYVSAMGGGTCNSEFEFLTGSSMGILGAGVYPYMLYDLSGIDSTVSYLKTQGYRASAIHPADAQNWRRDRVYKQLGFDKFYSITSFENPVMFRDMVSDASTFDKVLELLDNTDEPQFIFDITIASHGGYDTGLISEDEMIHVTAEGEDAELKSQIDEYVSSIARSQREFSEFLGELEQREEPIVVIFFGDHQPGFVDELANYDGTAENASITEAQQRYVTPYLIWTNSEELASAAAEELAQNEADLANTSLNYLAADALKAAGLELDDYFSFLYETQKSLVAINLNGYCGSDGEWHWNGTSSAYDEVLANLSMVQYYNLFDD